MERVKKNDFLLIGIILCIGLISLVGIEWYKHATTYKGYAVVTVNGVETGRYALDKDCTVTIESEDGGYNVLRIQDGVATIKEASCPDKLCVKQGKIDKNGETLVCLPNQVIVEIVSDAPDSDEGAENDVDISTN